MKPNIIEEAWKDFREHVIPKDASEEQLIDCKRIFFAGALVAFNAVAIEIEEPDTKHVEKLSAISDELSAFKDKTANEATAWKKSQVANMKMGHA